MDYICLTCEEPCDLEEDVIHYSGTHCTHGQSGVYHTGHYYSDCCMGDYKENDE